MPSTPLVFNAQGLLDIDASKLVPLEPIVVSSGGANGGTFQAHHAVKVLVDGSEEYFMPLWKFHPEPALQG